MKLKMNLKMILLHRSFQIVITWDLLIYNAILHRDEKLIYF